MFMINARERRFRTCNLQWTTERTVSSSNNYNNASHQNPETISEVGDTPIPKTTVVQIVLLQNSTLWPDMTCSTQ